MIAELLMLVCLGLIAALAWWPCAACESTSTPCSCCSGTTPATMTLEMSGFVDNLCEACEDALAGTYVLPQTSDCTWEAEGDIEYSEGCNIHYWARVMLVCDGATIYYIDFIACYLPCTGGYGTTWSWTMPYAGLTLDCTATHEDADFTHDLIIHGTDGPCGDTTTWPTITLN